MSYLLSIETANPSHQYSQKELADFYCNSLEKDNDDTIRKINTISRKTGIKVRFSVIPDFSKNAKHFSLFKSGNGQETLPGISQRMAIYKEEAFNLSLKAINKIKEIDKLRTVLTHIITVTCTGLFAPGLDIQLIKELELNPSIKRSSINFMGCNAAILALRQADQICRAETDAIVLIVCTELCTLHFQKQYSDDYIISNLLFADGAAACIVASQKNSMDSNHQLEIKAFQSLLIHEGYDEMAWQLSETGFIMNLGSYVSGLLNSNMSEILHRHEISTETIDHLAIHPGGKKILDEFCSTMKINKNQIASSYEVLSNYGNMSSPTILFVLQELLNNNNIEKGENIYAAAFGPGLSIESSLLEYV